MSGDYDTKLLSVIEVIAGEEDLEENYLRLKKLMDAYAIEQGKIYATIARQLAFDEGYQEGYQEGLKDVRVDITQTHPEMCKELEDALNEADKS